MKLIKPSWEILNQKPGLEGIYEMIELAGRTCYKSKRPEGKTAKDFVDLMIKNKHHAMLEHGTVYLLYSECCYNRRDRNFMRKYEENPYSRVIYIGCDDDLVEPNKFRGDILGTDVVGNALHAITTNLRVLVENDWLDDLQYLREPTEYHEKRITVKFTTSNGIARELARHRTMSFAQESTRYCNYSRDRFGNEITFIRPYWYDKENPNLRGAYLVSALGEAEKHYMALIENGCKPQEAREVLPLATKCDMVMTGFVSDWKHFFDLRARGTTGAPHPDAKALAEPLMHEFEKRQLI